MATLYWTGLATAVVQVSSQTFGTYDATTTRRITIGGVVYGLADTGGNLTAALTAFATYLNLATGVSPSSHPYFGAITWSSNATQIIGTADVAGCPFTMTGSVTGGTGTVSNSGVQVDSTACAGPNFWSTAANWSTGVVPASGDTVIIANSSVNICYGLTTGVTGVTLIRQEMTYTGKIGLDYLKFATSADGATVVATAVEYRPCYVTIGCASYRHGDSSSIGTPSGSTRSLWDFGSTTTCVAEIINTASSSADSNRPAVRLLFNKSASALNVRLALGGVGIAAEVPAEATSIGTINISDTTSTSKVFTGRGITIGTSWTQDGGNNVLQSDNTMPLIVVNGGTLRTEGAGATTLLNSYGGTTLHNSSGTTSTIRLDGGSVSSWGSAVARTWTTINVYERSTLIYDPAVITNTAIVPQKRLTLVS